MFDGFKGGLGGVKINVRPFFCWVLRFAAFANTGCCLRLFEKNPKGLGLCLFFKKTKLGCTAFFCSRSVKYSLKKIGKKAEGLSRYFFETTAVPLAGFLLSLYYVPFVVFILYRDGWDIKGGAELYLILYCIEAV
jgi:hypothetical protein